MASSARFRASLLTLAAVCLACHHDTEDPAATLASGEIVSGDTPKPDRAPTFLGEDDERLRHALATAAIERVKKGSGGRSLAFKLTLVGGVEGYFKPEQTFGANWNSELAAYYLDRELGLRRTAPAVGRRIDWTVLQPHAARDRRLKEIIVRRGSVRGSLVWWIPQDLVPLELPPGWEGWLRVEREFGVSPFQSPTEHKRALRRGKGTTLLDPPPPDAEDRPAELSDLILFDYLIGNLDRWGSKNTNVRVLAGSKKLVYLDNANGFELRAKPSKLLEARLSALQRFRKETIAAIRALDVKRLEQRMALDPLAPLLSQAQLEALEQRRQRVLAHVSDVEKKYGATAW